MKRGNIIRTLGILALLLVVFYIATNSITKFTGFSIANSDNLRSCFKEKDITLYINSVDALKTLTKMRTSKYLTEVEWINCYTTRNKCNDLNYFPTWKIEGETFVGDLSVRELSELSGCKV